MVIRVMNFILEVPQVTELEQSPFNSEEFLVQGIPWKVSLFVKFGYLIGSLQCNKSQNETWSHPVLTSFTLLSFGDKTKHIQFPAEPFVCNQKYNSVCTKIIKWLDLFAADNNYVKNDAINLEIEIVPADPDDDKASVLQFENVPQICEECTKKHLVILNIDNLMAVRSPDFEIKQLSCFLSIVKDSSNRICVGLFLEKRNSV